MFFKAHILPTLVREFGYELTRHRFSSPMIKWPALRNTVVEIEAESHFKIPPLLLTIIVQNGVLESVLQVLSRNNAEIVIQMQKKLGSWLFRKTYVRNKLDGVVIMWAESKIKTRNLPNALRYRIIEGKHGVGSIIENLRIETYRRIRVIGFDRKDRTMYRTYEIYIRKRLAITIKEFFPIDLPLWNS